VQPPPLLKDGDDCPDSTLAVKGLTNSPQYYIGDQPKFSMVVTNIGLVSCKRDVGAAVLAAYVYSLDNKRLWSNLDCAPSNETLVKTFTAGEQVTTAVTWTGMGSAPHCPLPRPANWGGYRVLPAKVEFWQGGHDRLHDRLVFVRDDEEGGGWVVQRLAP